MKKSNKKGFTIVELVIVIAVIAILAAVLIPTFSGLVEKANASKALQECKNAYTTALAECLADDGVIVADETHDINGNNVTVNADATTISYNGYVFTVDAQGVLTAVADKDGYQFTVVDGAVAKAEKISA